MRRLIPWAILSGCTLAGQVGPKPLKIGNVTVQGSVRTRTEIWDWFQPSSGDPSYAFQGTLARISFSQTGKNFDWQVELAAPILLGLPDQATAPGAQGEMGLGATYFNANKRNRNTAMIFPKQVFVRVKGLGGPNHSVRFGRFEFADGLELVPKNATLAALKRERIQMRLIGPFNFTHVHRAFDGAHYAYARPDRNITAVFAVPTRGVFQTDGWGWNRIAFGYGSYTRNWGSKAHSADTRVFLLHYHDARNVVKTDNRALAVRRADTAPVKVATFGFHSVHAFESKRGTADFLVWAAGQTGSWGRNDHGAGAIAIEAGFQPKMASKLKPWFRGGFYHGSGDNDPADNKHGTFFQVLPTPRFYARFPFFNMMNNQDIMGALTLRPHAAVTISNEFHALRLANRNDLWLAGGGAFQPRTFGFAGRATGGSRSLANLWDTNIDWRARPNVTVTTYLGVAQARAAARFVYPRPGKAAFGLVELTYRF